MRVVDLGQARARAGLRRGLRDAGAHVVGVEALPVPVEVWCELAVTVGAELGLLVVAGEVPGDVAWAVVIDEAEQTDRVRLHLVDAAAPAGWC